MQMELDPTQGFETHRAYLTRLAYRMLGSVTEAEDAVQDSFLRWQRKERLNVDDPRAFLSRIVTRLCLDRLRQLRSQREIYVGEWLPEPLVEDTTELGLAMPAEHTDHEVSVALMMALERLSPLERAAFILHDIFEMEFAEVASAIGRSEAACRQLASRARNHVIGAKPRFKVDHKEGARLADAFFDASRSGDATGLQALLVDSAMLHSDGGGRKPAAFRVIKGADKIGRFYTGLARKGTTADPIWTQRVNIDGLPGMLSVERDGTFQTTAIEPSEGRIRAIYVTRNPDKLRHLKSLLPEHVASRIVL